MQSLFILLFLIVGYSIPAAHSLADEYPATAWDFIPFMLDAKEPAPLSSIRSMRQPLQLESHSGAMLLAIRKSGELLIHTSKSHLSISIFKQDLNWEAGPDPLNLSLYDSFDRLLFAQEIEDDGDQQATFWRGPIITKTFDIRLPTAGIYRIQAVGSRDQTFFLDADAEHQAYYSTLELTNSILPMDLYFPAPPETLEISLSTLHEAGLNQTVSLYDSIGRLAASVNLSETNKQYVLRAVPSTEEAGLLWRLSLKAQDLVMQSPNISYWFLRPEDYFPFDQAASLLQPRSLELYAVPGADIPLRFKIANDRSQPMNVIPQAIRLEGPDWPIAAPAAPATVNSASFTAVYFHLTVPANAQLGETVSYQIDLLDSDNQPLASSLAIVHATQPPALPSPPRWIYLTPERLEQIRHQGREGQPYQRAIYQNLLQWGDQIVSEHLPVPEEEGGWFNNYICDGVGDGDDDPNNGTGAPLIFNPNRPGFFISSVDGRRYRGRRYERGWLGHYHFEMGTRLQQLGLAYALEPTPQYAALAREMLLAYADRYLSWPLDDFQDRPSPRAARILTDTLGESQWLLGALTAYDFTRRDPLYSPADRTHIELNLLRPAVDIVRGNPMGAVNWQSWHNAAIAFAGYLFDDDALLQEALYGPNGHEFLKQNAIRDDGLWIEGSIAYHYFALAPMNLLLEALESHGVPAFDDRIQAAYSAPLDLMQPDGRFPALNDASPQPIWRLKNQYEYANAHYGGARFYPILSFIYDELGYPRDSMEALFFGKDYESNPQLFDSSLKEGMGLAVLRSGSLQQDQMALMDFGPMGMAHGHRDKLHLSLYGAGEVWLLDIGNGSVLLPEFTGWFRSTIGHNAILLGENYQNEDAETVRPIGAFSAAFPLLRVMQSAFGAPVYPAGSQVSRAVLMADRFYCAVIDDVQGGPPPYDFVFHTAGDLSTSDPYSLAQISPGWESSQTGYQFLRPPRLLNGAPVATILQYTTTNGGAVISEKTYGFGDDFENVDDWSGNIGIDDDAVQGAHSLRWVIVPRDYQSIQKEFSILDEPMIAPDRLTFQYKIGGATFSRLLLTINAPPLYRNAQYEIARGAIVETGRWLTAEVDLTKPIAVAGGNRSHGVVQFLLTGADQGENAFSILIDDLQAFSKGVHIPQQTRGLQFLFPGGTETQYFLASGPSSEPPRVHPVVIARRAAADSTRHIAVLEPFITQPKILDAKLTDQGQMVVHHADFTDVLAFDPANKTYSLIRRNSGNEFAAAVLINGREIAGDGWSYRAETATSFALNLNYTQGEDRVFLIEKEGEAPDRLELAARPDSIMFLDGNKIDIVVWMEREGRFYASINNLPTGAHVLEINSPHATTVDNWPIHKN
ncbi:MAG: heparinase II/III family protein [Candidatus Omnitrophota bacterium]